MIKGWGKVKDKYYYFNTKTGVMAANTTVQGIKVDKSGLPSGGNNAVEMLLKAQNYGSGTKYLILVNRSAHKVAVYQGSKNNWKQIYYWSCSVGKVINGKSITPAGNFRVSGYKIYRFGAQSRSFYCTVLSSGNMIHSVQYAHGDSSPVHVVDGRLGYHITNSCIRLLVQNAKWVYNNCHEGTAVIVYNP
jgi:lipoprotein-anchoring transpeptidase ErfK/SrfK